MNNETAASRTAKATEARKANALARRQEEAETAKRTAAEKSIVKRYGEFLPNNSVDPVGVYKLWQKSIFGDAEPDDTIMYFVVSQANAAGIDPRVPRQIYAIPYNNNFKDGNGQWHSETKWQVIIGIEGLVTIAERTGQYGGCTKPEYEFGEDAQGNVDYNKVISCTIGVHKIVQGIPTTSYQTVYFDEYTTGKNLWKRADATKRKQKYENGKPTGEYEEVSDGGKPKTMLKKVALAHALRATFSACAGLYVAEEIERENVIDGDLVTPDVQEQIEKARDFEELQEILGNLSVEDKKRVAPLIAERMKELAR